MNFRRALFEYDIAITNVRQNRRPLDLKSIGTICIYLRRVKHKATDKANVMFQTDFLEETYCDFSQ
jgi:hypothetical protein